MTLEYSKHKAILLQLLKDIYTDTSIAPYLGFKGGTAAMMFYGLSRDSVDLDFDLLDESKQDMVFEVLQKITASYGKIIDSRLKRFNLLNVISYAAGAPKIKVEVSRRNFGSRFELKSLLGISMLVMVEADMYANKLVAMYERIGKTSRDVFDVYFFEKKGWEINKEIVEERTGLPFKEMLVKTVEMLEKMQNKHILDGLGELLTSSQKDWARNKLKDDTVFLLKLKIESLGRIDEMTPYRVHEIESIRSLINEKHLKGTKFFCQELSIRKDKVFFDENGSDYNSFGYRVKCLLLEEGRPVKFRVVSQTKKGSAEEIAFEIAMQVWSKLDGDKDSELFKKL